MVWVDDTRIGPEHGSDTGRTRVEPAGPMPQTHCPYFFLDKKTGAGHDTDGAAHDQANGAPRVPRARKGGGGVMSGASARRALDKVRL